MLHEGGYESIEIAATFLRARAQDKDTPDKDLFRAALFWTRFRRPWDESVDPIVLDVLWAASQLDTDALYDSNEWLNMIDQAKAAFPEVFTNTLSADDD
jgi:hypothetical protein